MYTSCTQEERKILKAYIQSDTPLLHPLPLPMQLSALRRGLLHVLELGALAALGEEALPVQPLEVEVLIDEGLGLVLGLDVLGVGLEALPHLVQQRRLLVLVEEEVGLGLVLGLDVLQLGRCRHLLE